jgi:biotin carboxylase
MSTGQLIFLESNTTGTGALFFELAARRGIRPVLISKAPERYPFLARFDHVRIDGDGLEPYRAAIATLAGHDTVRGIWSSSDSQIETAARLARAFDLPHADPDAVALCRDKFRCRERLAECGLPTPPFALVRTRPEAEAFVKRLGQPVVVKPRASTGSIGVHLCENAASAGRHTAMLLAAGEADPSAGVLVEGYIDGAEYSIEVFDGKCVGVTRKHLGPAPSFVETGHDFPAPDVPGHRDELAACAEKAVAAAGHLRGPAHVEARRNAEGVHYIIEINPRLAGGMIPDLVDRAYGIDLIDASIRFACGLRYDLAASNNRAAAIRFLLRPPEHIVTAVSGLQNARATAGVVDVAILDHALGRSGPVRDFRDRIAYVIAEAPDPVAAGRVAEAGLARLGLRIGAADRAVRHA